LVKRLAQERPGGVNVVAVVLPTLWDLGPALADLFETHRPAAVLHVGVATRTRHIRIERRAARARRPDARDAAGALPVPLAETEPAFLPVTLPVNRLIERIAATGLPVAASDDAGRYVCDATLYASLQLSQALPRPPRVGFMHIPMPRKASAAGYGLTREGLFIAGRAAVGALAALCA